MLCFCFGSVPDSASNRNAELFNRGLAIVKLPDHLGTVKEFFYEYCSIHTDIAGPVCASCCALMMISMAPGTMIKVVFMESGLL